MTWRPRLLCFDQRIDDFNVSVEWKGGKKMIQEISPLVGCLTILKRVQLIRIVW